jgi:hypothetical protein
LGQNKLNFFLIRFVPIVFYCTRNKRELRETFLNLTRPLLAEAPPFNKDGKQKINNECAGASTCQPVSDFFFCFVSFAAVVLLFVGIRISGGCSRTTTYILDRHCQNILVVIVSTGSVSIQQFVFYYNICVSNFTGLTRTEGRIPKKKTKLFFFLFGGQHRKTRYRFGAD